MTRTLALLATVFVLAVGVFWGLKRIPVPHHAQPAQHQPAALTNREHKPSAEQPDTARPDQPLPNALADTSLAGTQIPGTLSIDGQGHLIVDSNSKAIMDYFLSLSGEMPDAAIRKLLSQWAQQSAGAIAADELLTLLDRYHRYSTEFASGDYAARYAGNDDSDIRQKLALRQQLRADTFGADTANALFADEDRYDRFSLARHAIMTANQPEQEKAASLHALSNTLPEGLAAQYQRQYDLQHLPAQVQTMKQQGADTADLYQYRQQHFGDAAALRMQTLDQQRQTWQARYQDYAQQRDRILRAVMDDSDQQTRLQALRSNLFNASEQQRAAALDRITP